MRNLKKLFAVIMTVAMLASIMVPALAADDFKYEADAKKLYDLGLFKGTSETSFVPDLGTALTRETGLALMIRAMGKEEEVKAMTDAEVAEQLAKVVDADTINEWAKPYVAYAVKNRLTDGIDTSILPNIKFGAQLPLSGKEFIFFMLKAMGYDKDTVPWDDVLNKAAEIGMLAPAQVVSFGTNPEIIRDHAVGIIAGAMGGTTAGGVTLAQKLVDDGVITVEAMAAAGYIAEPTATPTPTPVALAVESVTAINNKQIAVVFNIEVDKTTAQNKDNYEIKDKGTTAFALEDGNAVLQDDKRTVIITLNGEDALTNSTKAKVTVKKAIKDASGVAMSADYVTSDVTVYDGIIPEVVKVEAVGLKTIRLTFSEPVYDGAGTAINTSNFVVKNGTYTLYVNSAVADYAKKTITLTVGTNLTDGDVTVTVNKAGADATNALRDFAGIRLFQGEVSFVYAKDTTPATVEVKEATQTKVVLKFSKPVYGTDAKLFHSVKNVTNYSSSSGSTYAGTANAAEEWTFNFGDDRKIPAGNVTLYLVNSTVDANKITDLYGNKVADTTLTATIVVDVTPPTVAETKVNTNASFDIKFSEEVDPAEVKTANFSVKTASDGKDVSFSVTLQGDGKTVRIARTSGSFTDNTDYEVVVKAMKDVAGNALEAEYSVILTVGDNTHPTVTDAFVVGDNTIFITFSEPMNATEMVNKANYLIDPDGGDNSYVALDSDDKIEAVSDKQVKITFHDGGLSAPDVKIFPITDLAGKRIGSASTVGYGPADNTKLDGIPGDSLIIEKAELIAKNKIKITFSKELATFDPADIDILNEDGDPFNPVIEVSAVESMTTNKDGKTEAVIIIDQDVGTDAKKGGKGLKLEAIDTASSIDTASVQGTKLATIAEADVEDKVAPTISKIIFVNSGKIEVHFSENLLPGSIATEGKNGFTVSGGTLNKAVKHATRDDVIVLTGSNFSISTDVTYTAGNIVDNSTARNALETVSKTADLTVATLTLGYDNGVTLTYNYAAAALSNDAVPADIIAQFEKPASANADTAYVWIKEDPNFEGTSALNVTVSGGKIILEADDATANNDFILVVENADGVKAEIELRITNGGTTISAIE